MEEIVLNKINLQQSVHKERFHFKIQLWQKKNKWYGNYQIVLYNLINLCCIMMIWVQNYENETQSNNIWPMSSSKK